METFSRENFIKKRPQRLCKMCGKCCRVVTASKSFEDLKNLAKNGDKSALDFLEIFVPYESLEAARKVDAQIVDNIIKGTSFDELFDETNLTFYYCKYLKDDNLCARYNDRKELCDAFPSSPWAIIPPNCGFEGWLFQEREAVMQKIRKEKEEIISLELVLKKTNDEALKKRIQKGIAQLNELVEHYAKYGSRNW